MRDPGNTGKFTRKILFPGPRIAVRGDTVLDVVSRNTSKVTRKILFLGPRIECGVTQKKRRRCYRAELVAGCAIVGAAELAALKQSSPTILLRLARSLPDKGGVLRLFYLSSCGAWQLYFLYS